MTQHNLQVPEELVGSALKAFWHHAATANADEGECMRRALQAILPKVRERLTSDDALRAMYEARRAAEGNARSISQAQAEAAFLAAFPPEDKP